jgi:hypothetical protein
MVTKYKFRMGSCPLWCARWKFHRNAGDKHKNLVQGRPISRDLNRVPCEHKTRVLSCSSCSAREKNRDVTQRKNRRKEIINGYNKKVRKGERRKVNIHVTAGVGQVCEMFEGSTNHVVTWITCTMRHWTLSNWSTEWPRALTSSSAHVTAAHMWRSPSESTNISVDAINAKGAHAANSFSLHFQINAASGYEALSM